VPQNSYLEQENSVLTRMKSDIMNIGKGLKQVWQWRDRAARSTEGLSPSSEREKIHQVADKYRGRLKLPVVERDGVK
jgi:hypothetical protein